MSTDGRHVETPWGLWEPFTPEQVSRVFDGLEILWWIAGGWALEAFVGHGWRPHDDVDVGFLRSDQRRVRGHLVAWDVHCADPAGSLRPWGLQEVLPPRVHDIWVREHPAAPWRFQLMVDECEGDRWLYRRDARVARPIATLTWQSESRRCLAPEVQLLYKAKGLRDKDRLDFHHTFLCLSVEQRTWLRDALGIVHPDHPWRESP